MKKLYIKYILPSMDHFEVGDLIYVLDNIEIITAKVKTKYCRSGEYEFYTTSTKRPFVYSDLRHVVDEFIEHYIEVIMKFSTGHQYYSRLHHLCNHPRINRILKKYLIHGCDVKYNGSIWQFDEYVLDSPIYIMLYRNTVFATPRYYSISAEDIGFTVSLDERTIMWTCDKKIIRSVDLIPNEINIIYTHNGINEGILTIEKKETVLIKLSDLEVENNTNGEAYSINQPSFAC